MAAIIEVKDLVKVFDGKIRAVDGITFDVQEGEIFGFLGPNGAGKSTTINMLVTLHRPTSGLAKVMGMDVVKEATKVRRVIGLVPQDLTVDDDLSGRENMILQADLYNVPKKDAVERINELLKLVKLEDAADRMVKTYSGGMRKRLELAEGLIHRPKILFLDEPTLGLDIQTRTIMWEHIRKLKQEHNMTVFMTTHYLEEADSLCDRIGIIDNGRIMALDTPATLKRSLGGDVIQMSIDDARDFTPQIQGVPGIVEVKKEGSEYRVKVIKGDTAMPAVLKAIIEAGGTVSSVSLQRPNMDQVFLEYTGRSLRDAEQAENSNRGERMARAMAAQRRR
ncbi:MAG: ATP-binding cassette domain-containing protein [Methanomassiliicoccales archaeon]|nr:ATP-binding cassette domain-containing protein [Methanomassiliicoccales archaeon]MDD1756468.1 ATP-binding cassette domain-containing protein [Methanomassiliicoccales archaeon]